ncbi:sensor domain-containing protein [Mycobacterium sp. SMC-4]|uniref:sensor domain-containing protein n=1 Tax=Mycobacterium sp. SMC-4 TaxID=2857059 RepID=UPI0021B15CEE|nr:sensor domain-containing protein [Mycobacterium sp. SMC-4]UXA16393.1 sensor domain-containing protein [Mycobacterium sp. SMC-4]
MSAARWAALAAMVAVGGALTGCVGAPVDQRPTVRIVEAAAPSEAMPFGHVLPTAQELSQVLGTGPDGFMGQIVQGDAGMLLRNVGETEVVPADCVSAAYRLQNVVYDDSPVRSVATNTWAGGGFDGPPVTGHFGIVQMASAAAAQEFFATLTGAWHRCNGQTLARQQVGELSRVTDVSFDQRIVSANILHASHGTAAPDQLRAVALAGDCIVEVELTDPRPTGDVRGAAGVAALMLDKIAAHR